MFRALPAPLAVVLVVALSEPTATPESPVAPVIAAAGDIACGSQTPPGTPCRHGETSDLLVGGRFDAVLTLGDNQYEAGALSDYEQFYGPTWGRVKAVTHPVPGNHEYATRGASGYFAYFGSAAGDPAKGWYSFDIGAWHVIALNSNCGNVGGCHRGSPQEVWLRADLAAHPGACTLAYWHHPRFTSGSVHEGDPQMAAFWEALYAYGAEIVLNGHQHNYERFGPQSPAGRTDPTTGIRQFVVGTGGKNLYTFSSPPEPNSEVRNSGAFGVLELTLHPTRYEWRFIPAAGAAFTDVGEGPCVGQPPASAPTSVSLTARPRRVAPAHPTHLVGAVSPCPGEAGVVRFQRWTPRGWRTVATAATNERCVARAHPRVWRTTRFSAVALWAEGASSVRSNRVRVKAKGR
jgi:acid phosphatase type 7